MNRKQFLFQSSGLLLTAWLSPFNKPLLKDPMERVGMSTVIFRNRFELTKPENAGSIPNKLKLFDIPGFYKKRFGINKVEFWGYHFESLELSYLEKLKSKLKEAGSALINIQLDSPVDYNLASRDEEERRASIDHAKKWIDAAAFLGSKAIRINPGKTDGSVEQSIKSMKEVNRYAQQKEVVLLTENHFGIEMDPEVHLKINRAAGPENIYTLPDFGNYPVESMYESLDKILPYAYLISAKAVNFNENMEHISYDFDKCVQMAEESGFKGVYSVEQWSAGNPNLDYEQVADWLIEHVKKNIS